MITLPKTFCIYPWIHLHLNTQGDVFPCCVGWTPEGKTRLGYIKDSSLEDLFNSDYMKQLRLDMLSGTPRPDACASCYSRESAGFSSAREGANIDFAAQTNQLVAATNADGSVAPIIKSWDIRFSNLCNYKCRSCGSIFSTSWGEELKLPITKIHAIPENIPDPLMEQYQHVEKIYFAGGEPLIMPEHFDLLNKLIKMGVASKITLTYNSNVSIINYKGNDILALWSKFKFVTVGVSIDAVGDRAEYIRKGTRWETTERNLAKFVKFKEQSNFDFFYSPTVSVFNAYHITDMHKYLIENNLASSNTLFLFNVLLHPHYYSCKILPSSIASEIVSKINTHLEWCNSNKVKSKVIDNFKNLCAYLTSEHTEHIPEFSKITRELDIVRAENFNQIFPEYKGLLHE